MTLIHTPMVDHLADGSQRWRMVAADDEHTLPLFTPLCHCPNGHPTESDARSCPEAAPKLKDGV